MAKDTEIIRQVLKGNVDLFALLVEKYRKPILRIARNITSDSYVCEDIAQDVFFAAYKKLRTFDPARSNFSTWLFTIARNKSINAMKKKRVPTIGVLPEKAAHSSSSDNLTQKELLDKLNREMEALPIGQKTAFVLCEFEGLAYHQIAQIEGVRVGTIKSRINRAKNKLRSALKGSGDIV